MIDDKRVLAVVPARGGSKGIRLKNLRALGGVSLVARAGMIAARTPSIDRAVVSTDHDEIAAAAKKAGLAAPFRRPEELSGDRIADWDVLHHALLATEAHDATIYDIVLMLQPTSPGRTPDHLVATLRHLIEGNFDAVWTLSETDSKGHPLKQLVFLDDDRLDYYDPRGAAIIARQQLQPVYHRNGIAYAMTRDCIMEQRTIKGARTGAIIVPELAANIDTEIDIEWAEFLIRRNGDPLDG